jgi:hypothetical protein
MAKTAFSFHKTRPACQIGPVCHVLGEAVQTLESINKNQMPGRRTVYQWLAAKDSIVVPQNASSM